MRKSRLLYVLFAIIISGCELEPVEPNVDGKPIYRIPENPGFPPPEGEGEPIGIIQTKNNGQLESQTYFIASNGDTIDQRPTVMGEANYPYFSYDTFWIRSVKAGYFPSSIEVMPTPTYQDPVVIHDLISE